MLKRFLLRLTCIVAILFIPSLSQGQERCGVAKDFMFQALERIRTRSESEAADALQLLKHANELCRGLGDAWYYRSLFERKLKQVAKAEYSLSNAKKYGSEAMDEGTDPFNLAAAAVPIQSAQAVSSSSPRQKWALVVGIGRFADKRVPRLNYTSKDASDFAELLKDPQVGRFPPQNVHLLLDGEATTHKIKSELNWLARSAQPDDLVVIFLSTHGSPRELDSRDVNYIVTSDTQIQPQDELFATALGMVELTQVVRSRILARRTAILLDTCHSGAATSGGTTGTGESSVASDTLDSIRQGVGRVIITSSKVGESSYENDEAQNGYFTFYLIKALRDSKGLDPLQKIYNYVRDQVSENVEVKYKVKQDPVLSRSDGDAQIVIGAPPAGG